MEPGWCKDGNAGWWMRRRLERRRGRWRNESGSEWRASEVMRELKEYFRPASPQEAVAIKREYGEAAAYLAGGSDILVHRPANLHAVIDIRHAGLGAVR